MSELQKDIEELLAGYFTDTLTLEEINYVNEWCNASNANAEIFKGYRRSWELFLLKQQMKRFNADEALKKFNQTHFTNRLSYLNFVRKITAVLFLPLLVGGTYFAILYFQAKQQASNEVWQTVSAPLGSRTSLTLEDGTKVWLNSGSQLTFPTHFSGNTRQVKPNGEVYFDVASLKSSPFIVNCGKFNIKVLGTQFNVMCIEGDQNTEIALAEGKIELFTDNNNHINKLLELKPGEVITYCKKSNKLHVKTDNIEKYTSWVSGQLIFEDDPMSVVVQKLERNFNVHINYKEIDWNDFLLNATFKEESLVQIMELMKVSVPLKYEVLPREIQKDGTYQKMQIKIFK